MTAIAIPRRLSGETDKELDVRRLQDYHTVQNTMKADGNIKGCHITHRQYLTDAYFGVFLEGKKEFLEEIANALSDPKWGVWLGRKCCIPSAPILAGLKDTWEDALKLLIMEAPLSLFTYHEEVTDFAEGRDSLPDQPISFNSEKRQFSPRRIQIQLKKI